MTMAVNAEIMQSKQQPLEHLLALPAELRNEIYSYLLPYPLPEIIIRTRYARLRWICTTRSLFNDVAPSLYSNTNFTTYLKLDPAKASLGTLVGHFHDHLHLTYGHDASAWVFTDACKLVRHIIVDVAAPELISQWQRISRADVGFTNIVITFSTYFSTVAETFPNLRSLRICFQDRLMDSRSCPSEDLRTALRAAVGKLKDSLSDTCELEALEYSTRNYNALSPLVMRYNVQPEPFPQQTSCGPSLGG